MRGCSRRGYVSRFRSQSNNEEEPKNLTPMRYCLAYCSYRCLICCQSDCCYILLLVSYHQTLECLTAGHWVLMIFVQFLTFPAVNLTYSHLKGVYRIFPFFIKIIYFVLYLVRCHKTPVQRLIHLWLLQQKRGRSKVPALNIPI